MKVIFTLGWEKRVMELEEAVTCINLLSKAERYEEKYVSAAESPTGSGFSKYHIYPAENFEPSLTLITEEKYNVAKLAGKPDK